MRTDPASVERREDWRAASILDSAPGPITVEFLERLDQSAAGTLFRYSFRQSVLAWRTGDAEAVHRAVRSFAFGTCLGVHDDRDLKPVAAVPRKRSCGAATARRTGPVKQSERQVDGANSDRRGRPGRCESVRGTLAACAWPRSVRREPGAPTAAWSGAAAGSAAPAARWGRIRGPARTGG
jgi:hypothetical protein